VLFADSLYILYLKGLPDFIGVVRKVQVEAVVADGVALTLYTLTVLLPELLTTPAAYYGDFSQKAPPCSVYIKS